MPVCQQSDKKWITFSSGRVFALNDIDLYYIDLYFIQISGVLRRTIFFCKRDVSTVLFTLSKVINVGANRKRVCDFLLVRNINLGPILHHFDDFTAFMCSWPHPYSTLILGCFLCTRSPMLVSASGRGIIFEVFQTVWKTSQRHLRTHRRHAIS